MYTNSEIKKIRYTLFFYDYERHVNEKQSQEIDREKKSVIMNHKIRM